jgi:hypothetical protein
VGHEQRAVADIVRVVRGRLDFFEEEKMNTEISVTIPAAVNGKPGVFVLPGNVRYFQAITLTAAYRVRFGIGEMSVNDVGDGFGSSDSPVYTGVVFLNDSGVAIDTTVYTGISPSTRATTALSKSITATATIGNDETVPAQFAVNNAAPGGTAKALAAAQVFASWVMLVAVKDESRTANAGNVYVGMSNVASKQPFQMVPGDEFILPVRTGKKIDLSKVFFSVDTAGDGLVVLYLPA